MEKLLNPYDKEYMKMAMLKHEETFKHQVYELHRLYRIQKILMKSIAHSRPNQENQERWVNSRNGIISLNDHHFHRHTHIRHKPRPELDLEQPAEEYIAETDGEVAQEIEEDESEIRLTLGPTSYYLKNKAETARTSDSGPSFSSSSTGSSHMMKRTTSGTNQITREEFRGHKWGLTNSNSGLHSGRRNGSFDVEEEQQQQLNQERLKQPPWLFQPLSMKFRT